MRTEEEIREKKEHCKNLALSLVRQQKLSESRTEFETYKALKWVLNEETP